MDALPLDALHLAHLAWLTRATRALELEGRLGVLEQRRAVGVQHHLGADLALVREQAREWSL